MEDQLTLFQEETVQETTFLNIVKDYQPVKMTLKELFNSEVYQELLAITFVASPKFFFSLTKGLQKVSLVMGIEDSEVTSSFAKGLAPLIDVNERIKFFNNLPQHVQDNIRSEKYSIRYSKHGNTIHSKIYLLKGSESNRLIVGSANFTETAFNNKKQFEEVLVFDNSSLFEIYEARFNEIYSHTVDYIPEMVKTKTKTEKVWVSDPEVLKDILLDEVVRNKITVTISEEEMEEIKLLPTKMDIEKEDVVQFKQVIEVITKKDKKTNNFTLLPVAELKKKAVSIKSFLSKVSKKSEQLDHRFILEYHDGSDMLLTLSENTSVKEQKERELIPFSTRNRGQRIY